MISDCTKCHHCANIFENFIKFDPSRPIDRVPSGHGKSWNLGRPFSRPRKSWKIAKVIESHGK